jgi:hypothetical protein
MRSKNALDLYFKIIIIYHYILEQNVVTSLNTHSGESVFAFCTFRFNAKMLIRLEL